MKQKCTISSLIICASLSICQAVAVESPFTIKDVVIYADGLDEVDAQAKAAGQAKKKGLSQLFQKLLASSQLLRIKNINMSKFDSCLSDYNMSDKRITSTSYKASFQLLFDEQCIRKNLNRIGIYFTNTLSPASLLIPIFEYDKKLYIWDYQEPYIIYEQMPDSYGMSQFKYIQADLKDSTLLSPEMSVKKLDAKKFSQIINRYSADEIVYLKFSESPQTLALSIIKETETDRSEIYKESVKNEDSSYNTFFEKIPVILDDYYKLRDIEF